MLSSLSASVVSFAPSVVQHAPAQRASAPVMETLDDLKALAPKLNPVVGYYNPLGLGETAVGLESVVENEDAIIGFLRHAEIKHGRVAMAAFIGFIAGENKIHFPWTTTLSGTTYAEIADAGGAPAQWDALPTAAKLQIILIIGALELWGETTFDEPHYMKGGKPGYYPSFGPFREYFRHPTLDLYDPFGFSKGRTEEQKAKGLLVEINNGRLAMLGIMGFVSAAAVEGSVPFLAGKITHYDGEVMAPFSASDASLPFVSEMLSYPHLDSVSKLFPFVL